MNGPETYHRQQQHASFQAETAHIVESALQRTVQYCTATQITVQCLLVGVEIAEAPHSNK